LAAIAEANGNNSRVDLDRFDRPAVLELNTGIAGTLDEVGIEARALGHVGEGRAEVVKK
jgi:hypothetical protein